MAAPTVVTNPFTTGTGSGSLSVAAGDLIVVALASTDASATPALTGTATFDDGAGNTVTGWTPGTNDDAAASNATQRARIFSARCVTGGTVTVTLTNWANGAARHWAVYIVTPPANTRWDSARVGRAVADTTSGGLTYTWGTDNRIVGGGGIVVFSQMLGTGTNVHWDLPGGATFATASEDNSSVTGHQAHGTFDTGDSIYSATAVTANQGAGVKATAGVMYSLRPVLSVTSAAKGVGVATSDGPGTLARLRASGVSDIMHWVNNADASSYGPGGWTQSGNLAGIQAGDLLYVAVTNALTTTSDPPDPSTVTLTDVLGNVVSFTKVTSASVIAGGTGATRVKLTMWVAVAPRPMTINASSSFTVAYGSGQENCGVSLEVIPGGKRTNGGVDAIQRLTSATTGNTTANVSAGIALAAASAVDVRSLLIYSAVITAGYTGGIAGVWDIPMLRYSTTTPTTSGETQVNSNANVGTTALFSWLSAASSSAALAAEIVPTPPSGRVIDVGTSAAKGVGRAWTGDTSPIAGGFQVNVPALPIDVTAKAIGVGTSAVDAHRVLDVGTSAAKGIGVAHRLPDPVDVGTSKAVGAGTARTLIAPKLSIGPLRMIAQESGLGAPDNTYITGNFIDFTAPQLVNDTRSADFFGGDLGVLWDMLNGYCGIAWGDTFGMDWTGPFAGRVGSANHKTVDVSMSGINVNTFTGTQSFRVSNTTGVPNAVGYFTVVLFDGSIATFRYNGTSGQDLLNVLRIQGAGALFSAGTVSFRDDLRTWGLGNNSGWRSNVLARTGTADLSHGYTIDRFMQTTADGSADQGIASKHNSDGDPFQAASVTIASVTIVGLTATVTTVTPHGLIVGQWTKITGTGVIDGESRVATVLSSTQYTVGTLAAGSAAAGTSKGALNTNTADPRGANETSTIPGGGIAVPGVGVAGATRQFVFYQSVYGFTPLSGTGFSTHMGIAYADDALVTVTKASGSSTVAAASDGLDVTTLTSITVASGGNLAVPAAGGVVEVDTTTGVAYMSVTRAGSVLTCTLIRGTGVIHTGYGVRYAMLPNNATFTDWRMAPFPVRDGGYVYLYGNQIDGFDQMLRVMRVPEASVLDVSAYRYYAGRDANAAPVWSTDPTAATSVFPDTASYSAGVAAAYLAAQKVWATSYINQFGDGFLPSLEMRFAPTPYGPWSSATTVIRNSSFNTTTRQIYGGFIHPWSGLAPNRSSDVYVGLSLTDPYSTFLMAASFSPIDAGTVKITGVGVAAVSAVTRYTTTTAAAVGIGKAATAAVTRVVSVTSAAVGVGTSATNPSPASVDVGTSKAVGIGVAAATPPARVVSVTAASVGAGTSATAPPTRAVSASSAAVGIGSSATAPPTRVVAVTSASIGSGTAAVAAQRAVVSTSAAVAVGVSSVATARIVPASAASVAVGVAHVATQRAVSVSSAAVGVGVAAAAITATSSQTSRSVGIGVAHATVTLVTVVPPPAYPPHAIWQHRDPPMGVFVDQPMTVHREGAMTVFNEELL